MKQITLLIIIFIFCYSCKQKVNNNKLSDNIEISVYLVDSANKISEQYGNDSIHQQKQLLLLDSAIKINGNNEVAYNNKIALLIGMHRFKNAIATINKLDPKDSFSHLLMIKGVIYEGEYHNVPRAQFYYNKSLEILNKKCRENPNNISYAITRAFTILFVKGKKQGIEEYNILLDKYKNDSSILNIKNQFYNFNREEYLNTLLTNK